MYELLNADLSDFNVRNAPFTEALAERRVHIDSEISQMTTGEG